MVYKIIIAAVLILSGNLHQYNFFSHKKRNTAERAIELFLGFASSGIGYMILGWLARELYIIAGR